MRRLTSETREKIESIINRLATGSNVSLKERILLSKYAIYLPFISGKIKKALLKRQLLENDGIL